MFTIKNEDAVNADLLSVKEAEAIPQWILACGHWWWLQSRGDGCSNNAAYIDYDGSVSNYGNYVNYSHGAVRPALQISNLPRLDVGELVKVFGKLAQYIGNKKVLLCEPIFVNRFDENSNNYGTSEVKQKLDEWFEQKKSEVK